MLISFLSILVLGQCIETSLPYKLSASFINFDKTTTLQSHYNNPIVLNVDSSLALDYRYLTIGQPLE